MTSDSIDMENSCSPQPTQKIFKEKRNLSRKQDLKPTSQTKKQMERADRYGEEEESITFQHVIEVDVEINSVHNVGISDIQKTPLNSVKPCSKCKSTNTQRMRMKAHAHPATAAAGVPCPSTHTTVPSSPSEISISDTAAEELCDLRNYYSKQLRRINYISREHLEQITEPGVLACVREPLKSLHLPHRSTISKSARSLWTRISGRRKLVHR